MAGLWQRSELRYQVVVPPLRSAVFVLLSISAHFVFASFSLLCLHSPLCCHETSLTISPCYFPVCDFVVLLLHFSLYLPTHTL